MRHGAWEEFSHASYPMPHADSPRIRIGFPWWLRPLLMRGVDGITIGRRVYIRRDDEILIRHELAHVKQIAENGFLRFYWLYVVEYIRNRRRGMSSADAYRNISFEREALAAEKRGIDI